MDGVEHVILVNRRDAPRARQMPGGALAIAGLAAQKGETVYLAVPEQVRRRDKVYLLRPRMLEDA